MQHQMSWAEDDRVQVILTFDAPGAVAFEANDQKGLLLHTMKYLAAWSVEPEFAAEVVACDGSPARDPIGTTRHSKRERESVVKISYDTWVPLGESSFNRADDDVRLYRKTGFVVGSEADPDRSQQAPSRDVDDIPWD